MISRICEEEGIVGITIKKGSALELCFDHLQVKKLVPLTLTFKVKLAFKLEYFYEQ